jgi:hypothetical protein
MTTSRARGRLTAKEQNTFKSTPADLSLEMSAQDAPIPVHYGRKPWAPFIGLNGYNGAGDFIVCVFWGYGVIHEYEKYYINGAALPAGVQVNSYRGTLSQGVDPFLLEIKPTLTDDMILRTPDGDVGIAYSVFKIPSGTFTSAPRFQVIGKGRQIVDPLKTQTDPYLEDLGFDIRFSGDNGTTPTTGLDFSTHDHSTTWYANAAMLNGYAITDGTGDYIEIPDVTATRFGSEPFTFEIKAAPIGVTGMRYIYTKGDGSSSRGLRLFHDGADLKVDMSSDGTTWDIASGVTIKAGAIVVFDLIDICIEWTGREYIFHVDDEIEHRIASTDSINDASGVTPKFGTAAGGASGFNGLFLCARLTKNAVRYGGQRAGSDGQPYTDTAAEVAGRVYDDLSILCHRDLSTDPVIGLGATSYDGIFDAAAWNREQVGGVDRARLALSVSQVRSTEAWLDALASYAECFWFMDGSGVKVVPDRKVSALNPSGWEMGEYPSFQEGATGWTLGAGWSYVPSLSLMAASAGTASAISQTVVKDFEPGVTYVAQLALLTASGGSVRLELGGTVLIDYTAVTGVFHSVEFVADGSENGATLQAYKDAGYTGVITRVSVRRKFWKDADILPGSLEITGLSDTDSPTSVTIDYTQEEINSPNWQKTPSTVRLPGVDTGDVPLIETKVDMEGVYRVEEAANKGNTRVQRMRNRSRVRWKTTDLGIALQKGTVVEVPDLEYGLTVYARVESVDNYEPGRYQVSGIRYYESHHPDEITVPPANGQVHAGMIVISSDGTVPSGWELFSAANGKYIKLLGDASDAGDTGGAATFAGFSGSTSTDGAHTTAGQESFNVRKFEARGGSPLIPRFVPDNGSKGGHAHTFDTGSFNPNYYRRESVLIRKTGSSSSTFPEVATIFGQNNIQVANLVRTVANQNRLIMAAASNANAGVGQRNISFTVDSANDFHNHWTETLENGVNPLDFDNQVNGDAAGGGAHTHDYTIEVVRRLKRARMAFYSGSGGDFQVGNGMCVLWLSPGDPAEQPFTGWYLCNGNNGTDDLRDRYLEVAPLGKESRLLGDNTLSIDKWSAYRSHDHDDESTTVENFEIEQLHHKNGVLHRHRVEESETFEPEYYVLCALMYNGD